MTNYELNKESYIESLRLFEDTLNYAIEISNNTSGIFVPKNYLIQTHQLFTKLTATAISIIHLSPKNVIFPFDNEFWDLQSVASLARNFIENYLIFYYVGIEDISSEERDFRQQLLRFHLNNEKYELYKELGATSVELDDFEKNLPKAEKELSEHTFIKHFTKETVKKILSGKSATYLTNKEIVKRIKIDTSDITPLYRLFSNFIHSTQFSYISISNERGRGIENDAEIWYSSLIMQVCNKYLSVAMLEMVSVLKPHLKTFDWAKFKDFKQKATDNDIA